MVMVGAPTSPPQVDLPCRACSKGIDPWFEPKIANRCALCISQLQECRAPLWDFRHFRRACRTVSPAQWLDIHGQVSTHTCMTITVILSYPSIVAKQGMQRVHASLCAGRVWCSALHDLRLENGLLRHFILKTEYLPRQARNKRRENSFLKCGRRHTGGSLPRNFALSASAFSSG